LQGASFQVSDLLEQLAPDDDREQGKDLADYLIKQDWRQFRKEEQTPISENGEKSEVQKNFYFLQASEKGEKSEAQKNFYSLQADTTKQTEYNSLSYFTKMFWDYRGGEDGYTQHKLIMSSYGK
jgi:hypothetical protein